MKVLFLPEVRSYLREVSLIMHEKEYFGFLEYSEIYMDDLVHDIITTLHNRHKKPAPPYFNRYGENMLYCIFPKNKQTQWYVFFNIYQANNELTYLIRYISNNHMIAQHL